MGGLHYTSGTSFDRDDDGRGEKKYRKQRRSSSKNQSYQDMGLSHCDLAPGFLFLLSCVTLPGHLLVCMYLLGAFYE
jgi:hypothetical protein